MASPEEPGNSGVSSRAWPAWGVDALTAPPPTFLHGADAVSLLSVATIVYLSARVNISYSSHGQSCYKRPPLKNT
jgi:hypothetical protein